MRELDRVYLVDPSALTLSSRRISALWADEERIIARADAIPAGQLVATTHLVNAPEGTKVEIMPDTPTGLAPSPAVAGTTNPPSTTRRTP